MLRRRASAELILQRAPELDASDRSLLEAIYASGQSAAAVARLLGQPQRTVSARVRRLVRRVCTPEFGLVLLLQERWPKTRREVARACFVRGLSIREASQSLGITFHAARKHHAAIRAMAEAAA
jgi:DNA-directed RNA polymerase specialized sigma24 family protein